ncbi:discoidin domain-containing protein [Streptomyces sp. OE57]|uniref:discoidin domain-containing protein n=1 Tax=Streptomyces lacaronensis TaxID=3379885 RepID=UPI0039B77E6B
MSEVAIRLFYASWDGDSVTRCRQIAGLGISAECELIDVAMNEPLWRASALRTVPAAQVLRNGAVVAQFDGKLPIGPITDALTHSSSRCDQRIAPVEVTESSGSYRYGRWSEPSAVSPRGPGLGWSSSSQDAPHQPWLVLDTFRAHRFGAVGITPRDWLVEPDLHQCLPPDFDISVSRDGVRWDLALRVRGHIWPHSHPQYWEFEAAGRYVKFQATRLRRRGNGRYVCQIHDFELWGSPVHPAEGLHPSTGHWRLPVEEGERAAVRKRGIWHLEGEGSSGTVWLLAPGAELTPRALLRGSAKWLVLEGSIVVCVEWLDEEHMVSHGQWLTQWPPCGFVVRNASPHEPAVVLEIRGSPETAEVWGVPRRLAPAPRTAPSGTEESE